MACKKSWFQLLAVFVLTLMVLGCICGGVATPEKVGPAPAGATKAPQPTTEKATPIPPTPAPAPTPTPAPVTFRVGDVVKLKDAMITVTKVEFSEGDEWEKPDTGKVFLLVHLHIENAGADELSVNPWDYKVKDSNGVIVDTGFVTVGENELSAVALASGGKIDGMVPFEVARGTNLQLIYQPNWLIDEERAVIELGASPQ